MKRRATLMLVSMNRQISAAAIMAAALALNFSQPSPALAWFDQGHMTIAAAAYDQLKPETKRESRPIARTQPVPDERGQQR